VLTFDTATAGLPHQRDEHLTLRPYQEEAVTAICLGLADGGLGQWHAACGSGKTLVAQRAAERILPDGATVAVLAPSLSLIAQTLASWREHATRGLGSMLAVCSDDTVADAPAHLDDVAADVTTAPEVIETWLREAAPTRGLRLIVGTYASAERLAAAARAVDPLDMLILDEAHHLAGRNDFTGRRAIDRKWLPAQRRLYLTATPRMEAVNPGDGLLTMSDTEVFGPVLHTYPTSRAIAEGYLEDYRIAVVGVPDAEARRMLAAADTEFVDQVGAPSLQTVIAQAALTRARQTYGLRRIISFHPRIDAAAEFARTLPTAAVRTAGSEAADHLYARHVSGEMTHATRARILDRLAAQPEDGWSVVSCARCLSEGVDVPAVDAVMFAHPKDSAVDIVQAVGRALRKHPDTNGPSTIIVPIPVPDSDGEVGDLEAGDFRTLWQVVRALRAHDEPFGVELDRQRSKNSVDNPQLPARITVVMPPGTSQNIIDQLSVLLVRQTTSSWWEGYGHANDFYRVHGHLDVPGTHATASGFRLGTWIINARQHQRKGWLSPDRTAALDEIAMIWNGAHHRLNVLLEHCQAYREEHGDLLVPQSHRSGSYRLGNRINSMRRAYADGRLEAGEIAALEAVGMVWNTRDANFAQLLDRCRAYRDEHGDLLVPPAYATPDGHRLGQQIKAMRSRYQRDDLTGEQVAKLEEAGMVWNARDTSWEEGLAACRRFRERHGHLQVPVNHYDPDGYSLGNWIAYQRALHAGTTGNRRLPVERKAALDELGMIWRAAPVTRDATKEETASLLDLNGDRTGKLNERIAHLIEQGVRGKSIATALGVTPSSVTSRMATWRKKQDRPEPLPTA
jgi:superfamily II DNA or RNA helicase